MNYSGAASHQLSHSFRDLFTPDPSLLAMLLGVSPFHIQPHFIPMKVVPCVYSIKATGWIARWGLHLILGFGVTDSSLAQFYKALIHALPLSTKCVWQYINDHIVNFPLLICFGQFYEGSKFLIIFQISCSLNLLAAMIQLSNTRYSEWRRRQSLFFVLLDFIHTRFILHPFLPSAITKETFAFACIWIRICRLRTVGYLGAAQFQCLLKPLQNGCALLDFLFLGLPWSGWSMIAWMHLVINERCGNCVCSIQQ